MAESAEVLAEWIRLQDESKSKIIQHDTETWQTDLSELKTIAGVDISYPVLGPGTAEEDSNKAVACVTLCSMPDLKLIDHCVRDVQFQEPYIPGFLAFRESAPLLAVIKDFMNSEANRVPDIILVDGNGILHPRRYGLACDIGLKLGIPTVGVAKNLYRMESVEYEKSDNSNLVNAGDFNFIKDSKGIMGMALKTTQDCKNPVYVSVGHKISLDTAKSVVMNCCKFRVPEPIRFADFLSRERLRNQNADHVHSKEKKLRDTPKE